MEDKYIDYMKSTPLDLDLAIKEFSIAYVPFGALEWHAEHSILGLDSVKATEICRRTAQITGGVLFPCVNWGAFRTMNFPYTFHFSKRAMRKMTRHMAKQLYKMGFKIIVLLTGHYPKGQIKQVRKAAKKVSKSHKDCFAIGIPEQALVTDLGYIGDHAAEWETSIMLAINSDYVHLERLEKGLNFPERCERHGIMGKDPLLHASKEKGEKALNEIVKRLSEAVLQVKKESTMKSFEEIYSNYKKGMKKILHNLNAVFENQGIATKKEGIAYLKWTVFRRKKRVAEYTFIKKSDNSESI